MKKVINSNMSTFEATCLFLEFVLHLNNTILISHYKAITAAIKARRNNQNWFTAENLTLLSGDCKTQS